MTCQSRQGSAATQLRQDAKTQGLQWALCPCVIAALRHGWVRLLLLLLSSDAFRRTLLQPGFTQQAAPKRGASSEMNHGRGAGQRVLGELHPLKAQRGPVGSIRWWRLAAYTWAHSEHCWSPMTTISCANSVGR